MDKKKLHVIIISTWMPIPGNISGIFTRDQAEGLILAGNKVSILMFQYFSLFSWLKKKLKGQPLHNYLPGKLISPAVYNFVKIMPTRFSADPEGKQKQAFLRFIEKRFIEYIRKNGKPDVIHHHEIADFCYITYFLSKRFNIPYVITEHSPYDPDKGHFTPYETKQERLNMIREASLRIAVSTFYKKHYEELFGAPFITVPNLISNDFTERPLPVFPKKTTPFKFLHIGSYLKARRQNIMIEAFAKAFKNNPDVQLIIISSGGPLENEIKMQIKNQGAEKQIILAGYRTKQQLVQVQDESNVLVVCSEMETFSVPAAEALSRGNPVLSTRCGGPEDFINEQNGLLCNVNDVADMQEKLLAIYNKYSSYNYAQIAKQACERFSEQKIVSMLEEVYRGVLAD